MNLMTKVKTFFGVQDMTVGKPMKSLVQFSVPLLIGNLAQQLYNTVDSIVVGTYIGDTALAAVGTATPIFNLLLVLLLGISTGASILTAQYFGAQDRKQLSRVVGTTLTLTVLSGIIMMVVGYFAAPLLVEMVAPPEDVAVGATVYLQIIFIGMIGCAAYNIISGVLRGMGDSVYPLIYLVIASLLNIALDVWFVRDFGMGVAGVAWATIIAQAISGALCIIRVCRMRETVDVTRENLKPDPYLTKKLCGLGMPAGITQAIFSMSAIVVQSLTNSLGTAMIAASVAVMRVDGFAMLPNFTFGTAATTFVGQNVGAHKGERVKQGTKDLLKLALGCAVLLVACILLFGKQLIGMFSSTQDVIDIGVNGLRWLALGYIAFSVTQVLQGVMRGCGETMIPMWVSIIGTVGLRMPLAYLFCWMSRSEAWPNGTPAAIFSSLLIAWVLSMAMTVIAYRKGGWKKKLPESLRKELD